MGDEHFERDYYEDDDGYCDRCGGEGWIVVCCDDLCHGQGWCMHGDGDMPCPDCNRDGCDEPFPSNLPRYAIENGWKPLSEFTQAPPHPEVSE